MSEEESRRLGATGYRPYGERSARDRPQGMLTYADREYLLGETEPETAAAERKKRERIRRRVRHGIIDFGLAAQLAWDDQQLIFGDLVDEHGDIADRMLYDGLVEMFEFMLRNMTVQGAPFERLLRLGLERSLGVYYLWYEGLLVDVDIEYRVGVDIDEAIPLAETKSRVETVDDLPTAALLALEEYGITSVSELHALGTGAGQEEDTDLPGRWARE